MAEPPGLGGPVLASWRICRPHNAPPGSKPPSTHLLAQAQVHHIQSQPPNPHLLILGLMEASRNGGRGLKRVSGECKGYPPQGLLHPWVLPGHPRAASPAAGPGPPPLGSTCAGGESPRMGAAGACAGARGSLIKGFVMVPGVLGTGFLRPRRQTSAFSLQAALWGRWGPGGRGSLPQEVHRWEGWALFLREGPAEPRVTPNQGLVGQRCIRPGQPAQGWFPQALTDAGRGGSGDTSGGPPWPALGVGTMFVWPEVLWSPRCVHWNPGGPGEALASDWGFLKRAQEEGPWGWGLGCPAGQGGDILLRLGALARLGTQTLFCRL